jgi:hypothetical protein
LRVPEDDGRPFQLIVGTHSTRSWAGLADSLKLRFLSFERGNRMPTGRLPMRRIRDVLKLPPFLLFTRLVIPSPTGNGQWHSGRGHELRRLPRHGGARGNSGECDGCAQFRDLARHELRADGSGFPEVETGHRRCKAQAEQHLQGQVRGVDRRHRSQAAGRNRAKRAEHVVRPAATRRKSDDQHGTGSSGRSGAADRGYPARAAGRRDGPARKLWS